MKICVAALPPGSSGRHPFAFLRNYLKTGLRKIRRHMGYSLIHIAGLAVALAFFLLTISYVQDELGFDRFHRKSDRIFQLLSSMDNGQLSGYSSPPIGPAMAAEFPEIVRYIRFWEQTESVGDGTGIFNQSVGFADSGFFDVFDFPLIRGDAASALDSSNKIILSRTSARKFFGEQDPLGKTLAVNINSRKIDFQVSGVLGDFPDRSSIRFDALVSFDNVKRVFGLTFEDSLVTVPFFHSTFFELRDGRGVAELSRKFPDFIRRHYGTDLGKYKIVPEFFHLGLQLFADYHWGDFNGSPAIGPRGRRAYSSNLAALALLALILACFNYANLAVGQSSVRFKEIGVRKTLGARRSQIIWQFLAESILLSFAALGVGFILAILLMSNFNAWTGKHLSLAEFLTAGNVALVAGLGLLVGLAAGSYPAFVLSRPQPVAIFRNTIRLGGKSLFSRVLLAFQFGISIFFIVGTLIRMDQMRLFRKADLGYNPKNIVLVPTYAFWFGADSGDRTLAFFKNEMRNRPEITSLTGVSGQINNGWRATSSISLIGEAGPVRSVLFRVDHDFVGMMGLRIVQGRDFSRSHASDSAAAVLVNETFVRRFNLKEPVGKRFFDFARDPRPAEMPNKFNPMIVGVVKDYHFGPLLNAIEPLVLCMNEGEERIGYLAARIRPEDRAPALGLLGDAWRKIRPDKPFEFVFLEDVLAAPYDQERNWSRIFAAASAFAVLLACLGLFGLTAMAVARRTKEIGMRKILGASFRDIVVLINRDFIGPLLVANLLAWPMAYWIFQAWLQKFAVRITLRPGAFLLGGAIVVAIAVLTVCGRVATAASADPVRSLQKE